MCRLRPRWSSRLGPPGVRLDAREIWVAGLGPGKRRLDVVRVTGARDVARQPQLAVERLRQRLVGGSRGPQASALASRS